MAQCLETARLLGDIWFVSEYFGFHSDHCPVTSCSFSRRRWKWCAGNAGL